MGFYKVWDSAERSLRPLQIFSADLCRASKHQLWVQLGKKANQTFNIILPSPHSFFSFPPPLPIYIPFYCFRIWRSTIFITGSASLHWASPRELSWSSSLLYWSKSFQPNRLVFGPLEFWNWSIRWHMPSFSLPSVIESPYVTPCKPPGLALSSVLRVVSTFVWAAAEASTTSLAWTPRERSVAMSQKQWRSTAVHSSSSSNGSWSASICLIVLVFCLFKFSFSVVLNKNSSQREKTKSHPNIIAPSSFCGFTESLSV